MISYYSMIYFKHIYLFSVIFFASFIDTELLSLPGRRSVDEINWFASHYFLIGILVVAPVLVISWINWPNRQKKREKMREDLFEQNGGNLLRKKLSNKKNIQLIMYTVQDIKTITNSYRDRNVELRDCNPGVSYRGILSEDDDDSTEVAVVKIKRVPRSEIKQFVEQLIFLSQPHNNLMRIRGCCLETQSPLIVYELRGDGNATLLDCIRSRGPDTRFSCAMRVRAAAGVARGVAYLHSHKSTFVHGNICSANILLDSSYNAKIFYAAGSNLLITRDTSSNCVYKDPKFIRTGRLNNKSDVYSFGVVLVELLTGGEINNRRMALDFVDLAKVGRLSEILDAEMIGKGDVEVVIEVAALAERCLNLEPGNRPKMKEVEAKISTLMQRK